MTETLFDNKPLSTTFVDKVGEVFTVPSSRYRTIVDLKSYDDAEKTKNKSITDTTDYLPLREQILRFFPDGRFPVIDGYEDVEDFDAEDEIDDKLDFVDHVVDKIEEERGELSPAPDVSEQTPSGQESEQTDAVDNSTAPSE